MRKFIDYILSARTDFHLRQQLLTLLLVFLGIFLMFYWTSSIFNKMKVSVANDDKNVVEKIVKVQDLIVNIDRSKKKAKTLDSGLLSYVQNMGNKLGLGGKIINIKLVSSVNKQEQVSFRSENLVYEEFTALLKEIEQFDNVWIKYVGITKRFNDPNKIDVGWDVVRSEP